MAQPQYVINENGKRTAVLLSLEAYRKLMEDLHDLAVVAERKTEKVMSISELKRRLKKDGLL